MQSLLGTPLGSSYMPRALDIEPALLGGRLQRMEDTTKIYKGLVRQGLGWAKVFQRVSPANPAASYSQLPLQPGWQDQAAE